MGTCSILRVPAELNQLASIRDFVEEQSASAHAAKSDTADLIQAVDEAATNIIVHGYKENPGSVEIEVCLKPGALVVYLRDQAPIFDPTLVPRPNLKLSLEDRPIGGLGVHLIRECVDEFRHSARSGGGNELVLINKIE